MAHEFDPGYPERFWPLLADHPGPETYPPADFRVEWGPIFHRGRLDGSARVLVLGQDPAESEAVARRILVGEAGHRVQGMLAKLGVERSYVMVNTFLYSVFGQQGGERHKDDPAIAAYRNRWLKAILASGKVEAVIAIGRLAREAWEQWTETPDGQGKAPAFAHVTHPTMPESASKGDAKKRATLTRDMLKGWNTALEALRPAIKHPDVKRDFVPYGRAFKKSERLPIPERDMPAGLPDWMRAASDWADRVGANAAEKRRTIRIRIP